VGRGQVVEVTRLALVRAFRRWRYRALLWLLGKSPTGRAILMRQWLAGFDTGNKLTMNREQRRAAARRAVKRL
jgi:hypothetical protein